MIKLFVDTGSSIKQTEAKKYDIELVPLKVLLKDTEYLDGVNLPLDKFYDVLINEKIFPKTSLPSLDELSSRVDACIKNGDQVIILTISSEISGTYNAIKMLFNDNNDVLVIDSKCAVGGMRIIVEEINKYRDTSLKVIEEKVSALIPKIKVIAVPETLEYLHRGGRLSKVGFIVGSALKLKPLITLDTLDGKVKVFAKKLGLKSAMRALANTLIELDCDTAYPIIPSYTYNSKNLDELISVTLKDYKGAMIEYDNLDPAIACHWGPNAFGYIFVSKK